MTRFRSPGPGSDSDDDDNEKDHYGYESSASSEESVFSDSEEDEFPVQDIDHWPLWNIRTKKEVWDSTREKARKVAAFERDQVRLQLQKSLKERMKSQQRQQDEVTSLLAQLNMSNERNDKKEREDFEKRSKSLWDSIENSIRAEQSLRAQEKAAIEKALQTQREQEARAKAMREAEQQKIAAEEATQKERADREAKETEEKAKASAARAAQQARSATVEQVKDVKKDVPPPALESVANEEQYFAEKLKQIKVSVLQPVSANAQWSKACFQWKGLIKRKVSQVTNSRPVIYKIANELHQLMEQAKQLSPQVYEWCLNFFSKAAVKQAEKELIISRLSQAYPLARICVLLASMHPPLIELLLARFVKKCPPVLPRYPGTEAYKLIDEDTKEYETTEQFNERMMGMFALYIAILQTIPETGNNPFPTDRIWIWLSRTLDAQLVAMTSLLLATFIDIAGPYFVQAYGRQAHKILDLLINEVIPALPASAVSSTTRLKIALDDYVSRRGVLETDTAKSRNLDD